MKFKAYNRHIEIEIIEEERQETNSLVVLPTDYKKPEKPYALGKVLDISEDVKLNLQVGETIIFEKRMLNKLEVFGKIHYLVLENYIYGGIISGEV